MKNFGFVAVCLSLYFSLFSCVSPGARDEIRLETSVETEADVAEPLAPVAPVEPSSSEEPSAPLESPSADYEMRSEETAGSGLRAADESAEAKSSIMFLEDADETEGAYGAPGTAFSPSSRAAAPPSSGLKAGYSDDNRQYGYFIRFLEEYGGRVTPLKLDISERLILTVSDEEGKPIHGADVEVAGGAFRESGRTHADGTYQFNIPSENSEKEFSAVIIPGEEYPGISRRIEILREGPRSVDVTIETPRIVPATVPLDIVFVMDTTGSMGEEIERLKSTIQIIHLNLTNLSIPADVRFGMVLYKDVEDSYRTRTIPLTSDLGVFQNALDGVTASGGGDTPEDLEAALNVLINGMSWNPDAIQLAYVITDALASPGL